MKSINSKRQRTKQHCVLRTWIVTCPRQLVYIWDALGVCGCCYDFTFITVLFWCWCRQLTHRRRTGLCNCLISLQQVISSVVHRESAVQRRSLYECCFYPKCLRFVVIFSDVTAVVVFLCCCCYDVSWVSGFLLMQLMWTKGWFTRVLRKRQV